MIFLSVPGASRSNFISTSKMFFFRSKRNKKTFVNLDPGVATPVAQRKQKFFVPLFFKKAAIFLANLVFYTLGGLE
jgi:hypothetical protein